MKRRYRILLCCLALFLIAGVATVGGAAQETGERDMAVMSGSRWTANAIETIGTKLDTESLRDLKLIPGGMPFGVKYQTEGVTVVGFCDVENQKGKRNPAMEAGIQLKDVILQVNGKAVTCASQLTDLIESSGGKELEVKCRRQSKELSVRLTPAWSEAESRYKTGVWVRDTGAGIGTVTFLLPDSGTFAGLGHGICDSETGTLIPMTRGTVCDVTINAVVKGTPGHPGELKGYFDTGKTGALLGNTLCGVWGVFTDLPDDLSEPIPIGLREDLHEGEATILCTLSDNQVRSYQVNISSIQKDAQGPKCFTVTVTDPDLLAQTGGIVQGMSGSPIIQDGKFVGAVTHVLINNPTTGYGIFIENMLANLPVLEGAKAS